jgi:phospholipid/cholesterol/gamma-HCH transport system ATP-binding protein
MTDEASGAAEPVLEIRDLCVRFGAGPVLRDLNLTINRGETIAIIGESGCGKTVLLKTMVALVQPTSGGVWFEGREIHAMSDRELTACRLKFGFVFQLAALFDSLNVFENVAFALREHTPMTEAEIRDEVRERLLDVGLSTGIVAKKPAELSGGMRKRVGLARAIALRPEVMLYDEPTTGLDPIMSDVINELILRTRARHPVTSVVVTHDMKSALKIATRIIMLYPLARLEPGQSQVLFDGPPSAIEASSDPRVTQFIRGEARERLMEMTRSGRA